MSEYPERFGLPRDVVIKTGLPAELVREMELNPERFGATPYWRPFPRPLTGWSGQESVSEVV